MQTHNKATPHSTGTQKPNTTNKKFRIEVNNAFILYIMPDIEKTSILKKLAGQKRGYSY